MPPHARAFATAPWSVLERQTVSRSRSASCARVNTRTDYHLVFPRSARPVRVVGRVLYLQRPSVRVSVERCGLLHSSSQHSSMLGVPAGSKAGWYGVVHVSPSGCVHVGHGQQKVCYKCGWDCYVTSTTRETGGGRLLQTFRRGCGFVARPRTNGCYGGVRPIKWRWRRRRGRRR